MPISRKLRSLIHYLFLAGAGVFTVLALLAGAAYYLAVSDQERVPEIVDQVCRENFGAEASFSHYRFQYLDHFPFLSLALKDVVMRDSCFEGHGRELLRIGEFDIVFRPWKLLNGKFEVRSISLDKASVQLYRSPGGYFNAGFLDGGSPAFLSGLPDTGALLSINKIQIRDLAFDFTDSLRSKHFRFEMQRSTIAFTQTDQGRMLHLRGDWLFHGLVFKFENGPYLRGQEARMGLHLEWSRSGGLQLRPSTAVIGADTLHLEGTLERRDTSYIRLSVSSPGIRLENAMPLLADNLRKGLQPYTLDQPVPVAVLIEGALIAGQPQPMEVNFQVDNAALSTPSLRFTQASLRGRYHNRCDPSGPVTPHSDCLDIQLLSARLSGAISAEISYRAKDMKAPSVQVDGQFKASLADINGFLPAGQFRFLGGRGEAAFIYAGKPGAFPGQGQDMTLKGKARIRNATLDYPARGIRLDSIHADLSFDEQDLALESLRLDLNENPFRVQGRLNGFVSNFFGKKERLLASLEISTPCLDLGPFLSPQDKEPVPAAPSRYKPGIEAQAGKMIGSIADRLEIGMRVQAGELRYRKLRAADVAFAGRLLRPGSEGEPGRCLLIDSLSARIYDKIPLSASLRLSRMEDPLVDMSLRLATPLEHFNPMLPPGKLHLKGGFLDMQLRYQGRLDDYSDWNAAALDAGLQGELAISGAAADYFPKGLLFRDFNGAFHFDAHDLVVDSLGFTLNGNAARARGRVEGLAAFAFQHEGKLKAVLDINTPELDLNRFPVGRRQAKRPPSKPGPIARVLESALAKIEGSLAVQAGKLHFRSLSLTDVRFRGHLLPACAGQPRGKACVAVEKLSAKLFGTAPFHAALTVADLENPFFAADVEVEMPLKELNRMFAPGQFQFHEGAVKLGFHYEGRPHGHFDVQHALLKAGLKGEGKISGGAFEYKPRGYHFSRVDAHFSFDEADLLIKEIRLLLNDNTLWGSAAFRGFLPFLFLPERELQTSLEVCAAQFDFGKFKAPQKFLQPSVGQPQEPTVVTQLVNAGLQNIRAHLRVDIDSLKYRNFRASDVKGKLMMAPDTVRIEDAEMALCDGAFRLNGQVAGLEENQPDIDIQSTFRETDIRKVFQSFDNFGQEGLTFENIRGRLDANILFRARADANYDLLPGSMEGHFDLKVEDGALINLPALDSMQNFLFRRRGLSNIQFATLENSFKLKGQDLFVDHFFVASTVLSFGVEGRYFLGEGPGTNLLFEVPVRNLFWRGMEMEALQKLHRKKRGISILLRATDNEEGGLDFKWVLSKGK